MKSFLVFFVCVALISYHGAKGEGQETKEEVEEEEGSRRQFPGPFAMGLNAAQAAASAQANANAFGLGPRPTTRRPTALNRCYSCDDCPDVSKLPASTAVRTTTCVSYIDPRCVSYVTLDKIRHHRKLVYHRACVSESGSCEDIRRRNDPNTVLYCDECVGDLCNSNGVARSLPDLTAALFFVVLTPILTKYALS
ncbi:hypothetical protein ABMA28_005108 [Loxostege sticticalis]|uniref:Uncharacterized protein n=1 Tax=Loxostege sticticalis TaxID=481309 RepID=A0ABD0SPA9_LOXSC